MEPRSNESFSPWHLLIHFLSGTIVFVVVALLAVGLSILVHYFSSIGISLFIVYGLQVAEYLLFVVDLLLFVVFVLRTAWRTLKKIWLD
jgi:hypothetical protein